MGVRSTVQPILDALEVAQGEIPNVLRAALRDLGEAVLEHVKVNWPIDTGDSLAAWTLVEVGAYVDMGVTSFTLENYAEHDGREYAEYVHTQVQYGGPVPLATRLITEAELGLQAGVEAYLSDRVLELLVPRPAPPTEPR
jgi:hypothetical protein